MNINEINLNDEFERLVFLTTLVVATKEKIIEFPQEPFHTHQMILQIMCKQMKIEYLSLYKKPLILRVAFIKDNAREIYNLEYMEDINKVDKLNIEEVFDCVKVTRGQQS